MPGISALIDSDMEDSLNFLDENSILSSGSENTDRKATAPKKTKKRRCVTMPKPKAKVAKSSPGPVAKRPSKKAAEVKRKALETQIEETESGSAQAIGTEDVLHETQSKSRGRSKPAGNIAMAKLAKPASEDDLEAEDVEIEQTPIVARSNHAQSKGAKLAPKPVRSNKTAAKKQPTATEPAPETQQSEAMDIDSEVDELEVTTTKSSVRQRPVSRVRAQPISRKRRGSASDTERGDPNLRRRLGDVTRKFENVDMKYRQLKEVGIQEAASNVEKLKQQCEATTKASNDLVTALKRELAAQVPLANESRKLKKEVQVFTSEVERLKNHNADLSASLSTAQNEIKALQAKLAVTRSQSVDPATSKVPGSTSKSLGGTRAIPTSGSDAAQIAQMKLDLYGDLTGLLVHSVKRSEDGDTYDCIQTGRNGTLHFKLFIDQEEAKSASFQETEFLYTPFLDAGRDRDMIELMPAYLTEDITFARQNAAKFYQRVVDTLTRRVADD